MLDWHGLVLGKFISYMFATLDFVSASGARVHHISVAALPNLCGPSRISSLMLNRWLGRGRDNEVFWEVILAYRTVSAHILDGSVQSQRWEPSNLVGLLTKFSLASRGKVVGGSGYTVGIARDLE
jgi:hypothetical protein